jgi:NTP pyrophosphatase (non-canonical NTP hydrolase)
MSELETKNMSVGMTLNEWRDVIHKNAKEHGFYDEPFNFGERIALIHSELSEALEADRKHKEVSDDTVIVYKGAKNQSKFEVLIKDTVQDELADALIRILDLCGYLHIDIDFHVSEKHTYNCNRPYKHGKKY